jgi:hypothetical protein
VPSQLAEDLTDIGSRGVPPAVLGEQVARDVPLKAGRSKTAVLELDVPAQIAAVRGVDAG